MNGNIIELDVLNRVYEIKGTTTTYGIKATVDCTILLNGVDIQLSSRTPIDVQNKTVTITLQGSSINEIKRTSSSCANTCTTGGTLTIDGVGKLKAIGGDWGAGIGGGDNGAGEWMKPISKSKGSGDIYTEL